MRRSKRGEEEKQAKRGREAGESRGEKSKEEE